MIVEIKPAYWERRRGRKRKQRWCS